VPSQLADLKEEEVPQGNQEVNKKEFSRIHCYTVYPESTFRSILACGENRTGANIEKKMIHVGGTNCTKEF